MVEWLVVGFNNRINFVMIYYKDTMPWKITLVHKQSGHKTVCYRSTTEFLSFLDESFDITINQEKHGTHKTPSAKRTPREDNQMQILFRTPSTGEKGGW